ncbi:MAG: hypothetical protein ACD_20C00425G0020 [uncultured bacterium]|nr:MAG: hypothetical protein ACD_20C00425G0020 [uncultured bacterium]HBH17693.1 hypothetical protein [Cyanobacteria bacterium UBA9579]
MKHTRKIVFFITLFFVICMFSLIHNGVDRDIWHRLAVGSMFFQTGWILNHDIFAYTPTKDMWIDHEWGSGVIFYFLSNHFGDYGLIGLKVILAFAVLSLILASNQLITTDKKYRISFYILTLVALWPGYGSTIRCQLFTYLFFTLWVYILERIRRGENRFIWIFPATMLLWVNLHGGFVAGLGLLGLYTVGEFLNRKNPVKYLKIIALTLPVTLINPYGIKFWHYMIEAITMPRPYITEWEPLNLFDKPGDWIGFKILLVMTILSFGYKLISKTKKLDWTEITLVVVTLILSIRQERQAIFFVIIAAIFTYQHFYSAINSLFGEYLGKFRNIFSEKQFELINFAREYTVYMVILLLSIANCIKISHLTVVKPADYPVAAIEFIKINNLKGNLLVPFNWGSYALWKLHPQCLVSLDGRYEEVYTNEIYLDVSNFFFGYDKPQKVLNKYHTDIILAENNSKAYNSLKSLKDWKIIYEDKYAAVLIPSSDNHNKWILPDKGIEYSRTKYLSNINSLFQYSDTQ